MTSATVAATIEAFDRITATSGRTPLPGRSPYHRALRRALRRSAWVPRWAMTQAEREDHDWHYPEG